MSYPPKFMPKGPTLIGKKNAPAKGLTKRDLSKDPIMQKNRKAVAKKKGMTDAA